MLKVELLCVLSLALFGLGYAKTVSKETPTPTVEELCSLLPGATILRPNTCTNWVRCPATPESDEYEEGSCVNGLYFNKDMGSCVYKDEMECPYENNTPVKVERCNAKNEGSFLADEENCSGYVYCKAGEEIKANCPTHMVFDPKKTECVYASQYTCPEPKKDKKAKQNPICLSLPNDVYFADKQDCTKYSHCLNGSLSTQACNDEQAWDYLKGLCVPVSEVVCMPSAKKPEPEVRVCSHNGTVVVGPVSDGATCSGYYFCKKTADGSRDRKPEHFSCTNGQFFDTDTLSCRDRLNVKCTYDRCEATENKYVNVAGNCKAYAMCADGKTAETGFCPSDYFFDERSQGCTRRVVSYAACSA
ncbi:peritrophin-44 [Musca domestica]|uniref:Peritrophin-44 n=1 Tax=Musca domestica TaxID=7370 RepID=A0A1I8MRF0_MUSDO|nr:peritrophin-44 [Musca domestica]